MKNIIAILCTSFMLFACAGRSPNPCSVIRPGDNDLSCAYLLSEMQEIEANISRLMPDSQKTGKNVALGVTGAFFLVPLFFMDFSEAEKIEIQAYQSRYNHLARLYNEKCCTAGKKAVPEMKIIIQQEEKKN